TPLRSTVPSGQRQPGSAPRLQGGPGPTRRLEMLEEPVHDRPCAGHVGSECAEFEQLGGERRARQVVRGELGEIGGSTDLAYSAPERSAPVSKPRAAVALVEGCVDRPARELFGPAREQEHDPVVLRQVQRRQLRAVTEAELRALAKEERHVGAELGCELAQM